MATNTYGRKKSTDRSTARPDYYLIGTDTQGADHLHRTTDDQILVINDGEITHRFQVHPWHPELPSVSDYIEFVRDETDRDWQHRRALTTAEAL